MARWPEYAAMARAAEESGFDSVWLGDHLLYRGDGREERGPWEVWTMLAGLAAVTERVELGPLVACTSFHPPGLIAKMAATVAEISGGRFVLGLGAGWNETEYSAFGLPYDHRVSRFEESFEIVRRALAGERVTLQGRFWQADDLVGAPVARAADPADDRLERAAHARGDAAPRRAVEYVVRALRQQGRRVLRAERVRHRAVRDRRPGPGDGLPQYRGTRRARSRGRQATALRQGVGAGHAGGATRTPAALEEAGADEAILVLRPITEASIRTLGPLLSA